MCEFKVGIGSGGGKIIREEGRYRQTVNVRQVARRSLGQIGAAHAGDAQCLCKLRSPRVRLAISGAGGRAREIFQKSCPACPPPGSSFVVSLNRDCLLDGTLFLP